MTSPSNTLGRHLLARVWQPPASADTSLPPWLHVLVGVSDDGLRIPGVGLKLGLDGVFGALLPGVGDALGGVTTGLLLYVAWRRGASSTLLFRMLGNATTDIVLGSIPVVGDLFDFAFHANRRNLRLLEKFLQQGSTTERASRRSLLLVFGLLLAVMLLVVATGIGLLVALLRHCC